MTPGSPTIDMRGVAAPGLGGGGGMLDALGWERANEPKGLNNADLRGAAAGASSFTEPRE